MGEETWDGGGGVLLCGCFSFICIISLDIIKSADERTWHTKEKGE